MSFRVLGTCPTFASTPAGLPGIAENKIKGKKLKGFSSILSEPLESLLMLLGPESKVLNFFLATHVCPFVFQAAFESRPGDIWGGKWRIHYQFGDTLTSHLCLSVPIIISFQRSHKCAPYIPSRVYICIQWGGRMECAYSILPRTRTPKIHIFLPFVFIH